MRSSMNSTGAATAGSAAAVARRSTVVPMALFSRKKSTAVVEAPPKGRKG